MACAGRPDADICQGLRRSFSSAASEAVPVRGNGPGPQQAHAALPRTDGKLSLGKVGNEKRWPSDQTLAVRTAGAPLSRWQARSGVSRPQAQADASAMNNKAAATSAAIAMADRMVFLLG
ncbi:hypothetical protein [Achromobacter xylosoxidans]|uniref:hypothetical protein n=1 Tax=Alcaligenes xylosoxydans xylosoxydans TaxID=85698 RepID=UPI00192B3D55|nr:hypothetical protein [Achromobacter xylosoxidans]